MENYTILLSATGRSGKDSICQGFIKSLASHGILAKRYAFADELKKQLDPLLLLNHGISCFTEDPVEKPLIRNLMITYGKMCREIDEDFWVKIVQKKVAAEEKPHIAIISDCRYPSEAEFFKEQSRENFLLHITRYDENGKPFPPIGPDEEKYDPELKELADFRFSWENCGDNKNILYYNAEQLMNNLFEHLIPEWKKNYPV